jgi:23S rRNA pseudouridine1911/1915/1917 synthase
MPFVVKKFNAHHKQKAFLFLIKELGYTQKETQRLIAKGRLFINGEPMCNTSGLVEGEFDFVCFEPHTRNLKPLFVSPEFAIFDKPSGVLIHPQNRHTPYSLVDEIKYQFGRDANITHRIDQETSGLVLAARNKESERDLKMMFEQRKMQKYYLAMVHGKMEASLTIEEPLLRQADDSAVVRLVIKVDPAGKASKTDITPLHYFPDLDMTLVEAKPFTGRQHQIRVHLFHVKHPIVGDPIYGQEDKDIVRFLDKELTPQDRLELGGATRLLLHAHRLDFTYKHTNYSIHSRTDFQSECFKAMATSD